MVRDFSRLRQGPFDLLVVGGGIYGASMARDAALRGLSVALVEKSDWGSATSSASSKLIHGGLRYLEHFWFRLVKTSIRERGRLMRLAPHRIRPLNFLLPLYRGSRAGRVKLKLGLSLYDFLAGGDLKGGGHRYLSRETACGSFPFLESRDLTGAFAYLDAQTDDARCTLEVVAGALGAGACALNRVRAEELLISPKGVHGAAVTDLETGASAEVHARVTVNAAGPWVPGFAGVASPPVRFTKGIHLVLPPLTGSTAVLLTARRDGRVFFLLPWYGATLAGTTDTDYSGDPAQARVESADVEYLLTEVNHALRRPGLSESAVRGSFAGLRTLKQADARTPSHVPREWELLSPRPGLLVSIGGKFTSARAEAQIAVDRVLQMINRPPSPSKTKEMLFPWAPDDLEAFLKEGARRGTQAGLDPETAQSSLFRFGTSAAALFDILQKEPSLSARLHPTLPFSKAEVVHAARNEMARTLEDVLRRRIPLGILTRDLEKPVWTAVELLSAELEWTPERKKKEAENFLSTFGSLYPRHP